MASTIAPGFGTTVQYGTATTFAALTPLGPLVAIDPPEMEVEAIQTSNYGTSGHVHTYQEGWHKPGKLKVTINWNATAVTAIEGFLAAGTIKGWVITINDGTQVGGSTSSTIKFDGLVVKGGAK